MTPSWMKKPRKTRRHRHRSYGRKVAESVALVFGTPFLLFAILAFSVQAMEYESLKTHEIYGVSGPGFETRLHDFALKSSPSLPTPR